MKIKTIFKHVSTQKSKIFGAPKIKYNFQGFQENLEETSI